MSITFTDQDDAEVNFSNSNAMQCMRAMGIQPDYSGCMDAARFNHLAWKAWSKDDGALSAIVRPTTSGSNWLDFGSDLSDIRRRLYALTGLSAKGTITLG